MTDEELERMAQSIEGEFRRRARQMEDFRYDEQQEKYWDTTTGILLGGKSVDGAIPRDLWPTREGRDGEPVPFPPSKAINDVDTGLTVEGSTWWPGQPRFMRDVVVTERGVLPLAGATTYNSYVAPVRRECKAEEPTLWLDHVRMLYPSPIEHEHFFDFCAHAIQRPHQKLNHGIVMSGQQGIGKDTALLPVRAGVGEWNVAEIGPDAIINQHNGYVRSVLLVINEVRPLDDDFRAANFYNMLKPLLAAPPEMLPMSQKYANIIYVRNLAHVILTTNDPLTMYIPSSDRRLFVMTSPLPENGAGVAHFERIHSWLRDGGTDCVINWLLKRDISTLDHAAPPPMTTGKRAIIESAAQVRRTLVDDVIDAFNDAVGGPCDVVFHRDLLEFVARSNLFDDVRAVTSQLNAKNFHFKMADRGYELLRNPDATEWRNGAWRTRIAFVSNAVPAASRDAKVRSELLKRPLNG